MTDLRTLQMAREGIVSIVDFGAVGDGVTDCADAFDAALNSFPTDFDFNKSGYGGTILVPKGKFRCSRPIHINRQVVIQGIGSPAGSAVGLSQVIFDDNIDGFVIHYCDLPETGDLDASGTQISRLFINREQNSGGTLGHAVTMQARAIISDCLITGFRQDGIHIVADAQSTVPPSNANDWRIYNTRVGAGRYGLYTQGGDVNAGIALGLECSNCQVGIYDRSFLGNTYIGCHVTDNSIAGYKTDNVNAASMFIGCYFESGQVNSIIAPSMVIGGPLSHDPDLGSAYRFGNGSMSPVGLTSGDEHSTLSLGSAGSSSTILALTSLLESSGAWPFRLKGDLGGFAFDWANSGQEILRLLNSQYSAANGFPRNTQGVADVADRGGIGFPGGLFFGPTMRAWMAGTAAPTTGTWAVGDTVHNSAPTAGGSMGWVCVTAGTPGVWKTFGAISA